MPTGVPSRPAPLPPPRTVPPVAPSGSTQSLVGDDPRPAGNPVVPPRVEASPARPLESLARRVRGRRAHLVVRRIDPWSVFVMTLLLSLFLAVMTVIGAFVLYAILDALGVPASINRTANDVRGGGAVLTSGRFMGAAALIAAANVVFLTVLATLGAVLYNLCATFAGGVELTLAETE